MTWLTHLKDGLTSPRVVAAWMVALPVGLGVAYTTQPLWTGRRQPGPGGEAVRLEAHVRALTALGSREWIHPEVLEAAAGYLERNLKGCGARVARQSYPVRGRTVCNVVARFGPEPQPGGQGLLVIGAHYDTCHGLPGADDNTSGVAVLLELARLLGEHPPDRPVELVAWTLEEPPHFRTEEMGSRVHAKALKASGLPVDLVLSLEMLGTYVDSPGSQHYPLPGLELLYPSRGNFLALVGGWGDAWKVRKAKALMARGSDLPLRSINAPSALVGIDFSDHASYWKEGLPALMLTDTAFFRNPRYHTDRDIPERLDYQRMGEATRLIWPLLRGFNG